MDLDYPIQGKEVAFVSMFSDNIRYEFEKPRTLDFGSSSKQIAAGTCLRRELIDLVEGKVEMTQFDKDSRIKRMNKSEGITEIVIRSNELDNTDNLENGRLSQVLLRHYGTDSEEFTRYEQVTPQYKRLKN